MQPEGVVRQPLYEQVAMQIRHEIATGALESGDWLPSLREGAGRWNVNLHTVRRAYDLLAEEGLVETEARRGTRVLAGEVPKTKAADDVSAFVEWVAGTAASRYGLSRLDLARRLSEASETAEPIWVIECTAALARRLADRVGSWTGLDVRPWVLGSAETFPEGHHLGTYYHYSEIREALAGASRRPDFFGVKIHRGGWSGLREQAEAAGRVVVLGVDDSSVRVIAAEVELAVGPESAEVELHATTRPQAVLAEIPDHVPVVASPENWERLSAEDRSAPRTFGVELEPEAADFRRIAARNGWPVKPT